MIKISVDEAGAYDLLAILSIKCAKTTDGPASKAWSRLSRELIEQLGSKHFEVTHSNEYLNMFEANNRVFNLINELKSASPNMPASIVDEANYCRYLCKQALQARFFPDSQLTEIKLGYDSPEKT